MWVGNGHNAALNVVSDGTLTLTSQRRHHRTDRDPQSVLPGVAVAITGTGQNDSGSNHVPYPKGATWLKAFVNYQISKGNLNAFLWTYTPNSGDTSGIIYGDPYEIDSFGVRTDKMEVLQHLWSGTPRPID